MENNITIYDVEQGSEAWYELRSGRITASKFSTLMSKITTVGYTGLIYETVGGILSGTVETSYQSDAMRRGIEMEPEAKSFYEEIHGVDVEDWGFVTNPNVFEEYVGVSPDGKIKDEDGIIEIKCPMMKTHVEYLMKDVLPNAYKWQVQGQLLVTGASYCDFMSYYPGIPAFIKRIEPNPEMQDQLKRKMESSIEDIKRIINAIKNR